MQKQTVTVANTNGTPATGATVQVRDHYSGANLTLYEDNETTTKTNPITVGASGIAEFKIPNSVVDLIVTNGADTKTITAVKISDGAELLLLEAANGISYGKVCFVDSTGKADLAFYDGTEQDARAMLMCVTRGGLSGGATGVFSGPGLVTGLSGLTPGASAFLGQAGDIILTSLDPTDDANLGLFITYLGECKSTTELLFNPSEPREI